MTKLDEMKQEATELGITFNGNIGEAKLQEKIDAHYEAQENSAVKMEDVAAAPDEGKTIESVASIKLDRQRRAQKLAREREAEARKTRVVTIIDNDQRVNNQTTSCTVSCSNMYFDLGTVILPLNLKVEVLKGHLDALKDVQIPQHVRGKDGQSTVTLRNRYTISYEDIDTVK